MKYSDREDWPSTGAPPPRLSIVKAITLSGFSKSSLGLFFNASRIILLQMGAAPVTPEAIFPIGLLSLFPTHVATKILGVQPIVQLSLLSSVVPVLTAIDFPLIFK